MKQYKSKKIIIVLIILIIILIIFSGIAYSYFATDIFKTDKQIFIKYASQILDKEKGFLDSDFLQYINKKSSTPYTNSGIFSVNIEGPNEEKFKYTNNMNIVFSGKVDTANSNLEEEISINYSDDVKLPFTIKKIGEVIGILQSNYVSKKYIVCDFNKITDLNLYKPIAGTEEYANGNIDKVEKFIDPKFLTEIEQIKDEYINVFIENLPENIFSKIKENGKTIYKLDSDTQTLKDIVIKLLEKLKNDKNTLDKINEYLEMNKNSNKITPESIEKSITRFKNINDNTNFTIKIYPQNGVVTKIVFNNEYANINIEKIKDADNLQYKILAEILQDKQKECEVSLSANYKGISNLKNISESYKIGLDFDIDYENTKSNYSYIYNFDNEIIFQDTVNIEHFAKDNSFYLNELSEEQKEKLLKSIKERLKTVNKKQMNKLGIYDESENPLVNIIPTLGIRKISNDGLETQTMREVEEAEIATFNSKLELYQGTNISGATVKGLLTVVANTNDSEESDIGENKENLIKEINFNGTEYQVNKQTIALIKEEIAVQDFFRVEFEKYEDTGKIYRVVINKK